MRTFMPSTLATISRASGAGTCPSHADICSRLRSRGTGGKRSSQISHSPTHNGHSCAFFGNMYPQFGHCMAALNILNILIF